MGIDMEIDLIAGPIKPKSNKEPSAQETVPTGKDPLSKLPVFTDMLGLVATTTAAQTAPSAPVSVPKQPVPYFDTGTSLLPGSAPALAAGTTPAMPEDAAPDSVAAVLPEPVEKPADAITLATSNAVAIVVPPTDTPKPAAPALGSATPAGPESARPAPQNLPVANPATDLAEPPQKQPAAALQAGPAAPLAPASPSPPPSIPGPAPPIPATTRAKEGGVAGPEPEPEPATARALPEPATRASAPPPVNPGMAQASQPERLLISATADDPSEMPVNIRIERQAADTAAPIQAATRAAIAMPVPEQITTQIQQQITKAGRQTIELRLDPAELGRVTIEMTTQDKQVVALISTERSETAELMRRHADILLSSLEKAGFSQANLSFQQGNTRQGQQGFNTLTGPEPAPEPATAIAPGTTPIGPDGRLDIRL